MTGTTNFPTSADDFSLTSPSLLGNSDSKSRTHSERHDDMEAAMEAVQAGLLSATGALNLTLQAGAAATPSLKFTGDTNTGIWSPGADTLAVSTGGTERLRVDSSGKALLGQTAGIGIASTSTSLIQVASTAASASLSLSRWSANSGAPAINFGKSRSGTVGTNGIVSSGDPLGAIYFAGDDGTDVLSNAASISAEVDGTPGANDMPGRLIFSTTPDGSTTLTERMRIDNAGLITGTGTSLGAWTAYTPTLGVWGLGSGTATGAYCQIGKIVVFRAVITLAADSTTSATTSPTITLPVTAITGTGGAFNFYGRTYDASTTTHYQSVVRLESTTTVQMATPGTNGIYNATTTTVPFTWTTSDQLVLAGTYQAA